MSSMRLIICLWEEDVEGWCCGVTPADLISWLRAEGRVVGDGSRLSADEEHIEADKLPGFIINSD